jgi:hypothetical protein
LSKKISLNNLYYSDGQQWVELPDWGRFFINLGASCESSTKVKIRLAVAIPTRAYAASLTAFGFVTNRLLSKTNKITSQEYFQQLCDLEKGTPVSFVKNGRKKEGEFYGCKVLNSETWIMIRVHDQRAGGLSEGISERDAFNVKILSTKREKLPKRQTGRLVRPLSPFAQMFVDEDALPLDKQTTLETIILGQRSVLYKEIAGTTFAIRNAENEFIEGTLQDILRVREYLNDTEHFLSQVIPVNSSLAIQAAKDLLPDLVIFDGVRGFLRWRDYYRKSNWMILLDRAESNFRDAAAILNQEYSKYGRNTYSIENLPTPITGMEMLYYNEPIY